MSYDGYIPELYELAQDLSPSLVFIEDIDHIGLERRGFSRSDPPLIALLREMDGITEKTAIVIASVVFIGHICYVCHAERFRAFLLSFHSLLHLIQSGL
jgi:AAA+ superfamily predicted ATPase